MKNEYFDIFLTFTRVGGLTFGGGYSMLPILQREVIEKRGWVTDEEITDYFAIGQCMPGIIAVNVATFIGNKQKGILGAIAAAFGVVFPSYVIITLIAAFMQNFNDIPAVAHAFAGVRVGVCALILNAIIKLWKSAIVDKVAFIIYLTVFATAVFFDVSPILLVIAAGTAGIIIGSVRGAVRK